MKKSLLMRTMSNRNRAALVALLFVCFYGTSILAQTTRDTDYKAERNLKSSARVNPSTLAMELSIPLMQYPGRGGNSLPVAFNYSSKLWTMKFQNEYQPTFTTQTLGGDGTELNPFQISIITSFKAEFGERTYGGWTTGGFQPITEMWDDQDFNFQVGGHQFKNFVNRVRLRMPDGSTKEFRKDDKLYKCVGYPVNDPCPISLYDRSGTYLSVDGSAMRYVIGTQSNPGSVLYLPDGGRYIVTATGQDYIDRNGNKTVYDDTTKKLTDTMGREITDPLATSTFSGIQEFYLPGLNGQNLTYTQKWGALQPEGCVNGTESSCQDSALENPEDEVYYVGNDTCEDESIDHPVGPPSLFVVHQPVTTDRTVYMGSSPTFYQDTVKQRMCSPGGAMSGTGGLTEIGLPDGTKYKFRYNRYGEMTKIIYPTGAYERFQYDFIPQLAGSAEFPFNQTSRGVKEHWVSVDGVTETQNWKYNFGQTSIIGQYGMITTAPDNTKTERLTHGGGSQFAEDPRAGMPYDERVLAPPTTPGNELTRPLLRRELTNWLPAPPRAGGNTERDARPSAKISITAEPGSSKALAQLTQIEYDSHTDEEHFAHLNAVKTSTTHYIALDVAEARDKTFNELLPYFNSTPKAGISATEYLYDSNYKARGFGGLAKASRVLDPANSSVVIAKKEIVYDNLAPTSNSNYPYSLQTYFTNDLDCGTNPATPKICWQNPNSSYRANATTSRVWNSENNGWIENHIGYDQFGNAVAAKDALGRETTSEFSATHKYAYSTRATSPVPDSTGASGSDAAFQTTTSYDPTTGLPLAATDANGQTTQMQYADPLLRPTKIIAPNGHQTITEYGAGTSAASRFVKVKTQIDETRWKEGYSWYDELGRTVKTQSVDSAGDVFALTCYDVYGRVEKTSNPFRNVTNPTCASNLEWTTNFYDDLSRVVKVRTPDNAEVNTAFALGTGTTVGTVVTVADQAGKQRRSITNALGQLIRVDEPNDAGQLGAIDSPTQPTAYAYDTLGNLKTVAQGIQTRNFTYDSLSRLKTATNPESGTITYAYDSNGNLTQKTDARGVTTSYSYDALNRVRTRSYGGEPSGQPATPTVTYTYDNLTNAKGKLIEVDNGISETKYTAFDLMGRVTASEQKTDGMQIDPMTYTYNLSGAMIEQKYPSGRVVKNLLDADGDLSAVQSKKNANSGYWNYASHFSYTAAGAVSSMQLGNGKWESTQFNSRLQPTQIALGTTQNGTDKLKLNFTYNTTGNNDNNGNVLSQTITVPTETRGGTMHDGFVATQNYIYDSLNRLSQAGELVTPQGQAAYNSWAQTFSYDRYGNRRFNEQYTTASPNFPKECGTAPNKTMCQEVVPIYNPEIVAAKNQLVGYTYDAAGNTIRDAQHKRFTYDAENKQTKVETLNQSNVVIATNGEYSYDGDGKRVKKIAGNEVTIFIYDAAGKLVAEYANQIAAPIEAKVSFLTSDHLGSPRINTDANGNVMARHDYQPFGEEIQPVVGEPARTGYSTDDVRKQFTSYERDDESRLDFAQARYYGSHLGRFTSPDPLYFTYRRMIDPQQMNIYIYVRNNPYAGTDPTGLDVEVTGESQSDIDDFVEFLGKATKKFKIGRNSETKKIEILGDDGKAMSAKALKDLGDSLKKSDKDLFTAITNKDNHATIAVVNGDSSVHNGRFDGNGKNTVDVGDLKAVAASDVTVISAAQIAGHETMEAFASAKNKNLEVKEAHIEANKSFPGLNEPMGDYIPIVGDPINNPNLVTHTQRKFKVSNGRTVIINFKLVTQIPVTSLKSAAGLAAHVVGAQDK